MFNNKKKVPIEIISKVYQFTYVKKENKYTCEQNEFSNSNYLIGNSTSIYDRRDPSTCTKNCTYRNTTQLTERSVSDI